MLTSGLYNMDISYMTSYSFNLLFCALNNLCLYKMWNSIDMCENKWILSAQQCSKMTSPIEFIGMKFSECIKSMCG